MSKLLAFTADHVSRLTGLSHRQLRYWDRTGFFSPRYADKDRHRPFSRVYSFRDVVGLRAIALLRENVPLQELRRVGQWLSERYETPWSSLRFYIVDRKVYFQEPGSDVRMMARPPWQTVMTLEMDEVARDMTSEADRLRERQPEDIGRIMQRRNIVHNAPVIAGTRIPTSAVWNFHQAGYSPEAIIEEYPRLTSEDIKAAIAFEEPRRRKRAG